ncbi:uncharacterized protein BYT42DRAFT_561319 [Radiomyces spectabilis]|uniref:uncharacterized protein n=1 Tax=Radiomyces spectabilis TaxID=64574 RepID=UPI00221ECB5F|nr:uncharacterized protein BYT42DRAFT_561319 [Radiomyces spectabilis]KAI8388810.1 hypothetical protein BYT42DRAFT_561319 [Radiomyces spectabilis]
MMRSMRRAITYKVVTQLSMVGMIPFSFSLGIMFLFLLAMHLHSYGNCIKNIRMICNCLLTRKKKKSLIFWG